MGWQMCVEDHPAPASSGASLRAHILAKPSFGPRDQNRVSGHRHGPRIAVDETVANGRDT